MPKLTGLDLSSYCQLTYSFSQLQIKEDELFALIVSFRGEYNDKVDECDAFIRAVCGFGLNLWSTNYLIIDLSEVIYVQGLQLVVVIDELLDERSGQQIAVIISEKDEKGFFGLNDFFEEKIMFCDFESAFSFFSAKCELWKHWFSRAQI